MNFKTIKIFFLLIILTALSAFGIIKNGDRSVNFDNLNFVNTNLRFISEDTVNKLLKQSDSFPSALQKRDLNLDKIEKLIEQNRFVRLAEIFLDLEGNIGIKIIEKDPVFRVLNENYYIDSSGSQMPVSNLFSKKTPLILSKVEKKHFDSLGVLGKFINMDSFLKNHISGLEMNSDSLVFYIKEFQYKIKMKGFQNFKERFNNYKFFYKSVYRDSLLPNLKSINLNFKNQVVVQKK